LLLPDVNVLVYAHREDSASHAQHKRWLADLVNGDGAFAVASIVISGFLRVVTHPKVFVKPSPIPVALAFAAQVLDAPSCVKVEPGARHWEIFSRLCRAHEAKGSLVPDAYLAALAIETGCELVTTDRDFARFAGLRSRPPLA
jgi:hypothetical protein